MRIEATPRFIDVMDLAQAPSPLVSASWLHDRLTKAATNNADNIVVFDCRFALAAPEQGEADYQQGHIPGAHYLSLDRDLSSPVTAPLPALGGRHPLPDPAKFAAKLNQCGVTATTQVVAYDDSRFAFASRLWWLLRYFGHDKVAVLDGGWGAWQAAGYEINPGIPEPQQGSFSPAPRPAMLASRAAVQARSAQTPLIDSRSPQRYRGEVEPIDPIAGSIPGAINAFWQGVTDSNGFAMPMEDQADRWQAITESGQSPMVYCGSGVTACVNLLSMAMAGIDNAQLYAGSWSDWCAFLIEPEK